MFLNVDNITNFSDGFFGDGGGWSLDRYGGGGYVGIG